MVERRAIRGEQRHLLSQAKNQQEAEPRDKHRHVLSSLKNQQEVEPRGAAQPGERKEKLYSAALGNKIQQQPFKVTIKSKNNLPGDAIKGILKSKVNPTDIQSRNQLIQSTHKWQSANNN